MLNALRHATIHQDKGVNPNLHDIANLALGAADRISMQLSATVPTFAHAGTDIQHLRHAITEILANYLKLEATRMTTYHNTTTGELQGYSLHKALGFVGKYGNPIDKLHQLSTLLSLTLLTYSTS